MCNTVHEIHEGRILLWANSPPRCSFSYHRLTLNIVVEHEGDGIEGRIVMTNIVQKLWQHGWSIRLQVEKREAVERAENGEVENIFGCHTDPHWKHTGD